MSNRMEEMVQLNHQVHPHHQAAAQNDSNEASSSSTNEEPESERIAEHQLDDAIRPVVRNQRLDGNSRLIPEV